MKQTRYLTATVQSGNRLEIDLPDLPIGQTVEIILIVAKSEPAAEPTQTLDRETFLKLPLEERRRILEQQAEASLAHYQQDSEWREWAKL
jgi:hypothetical protein